MKFNFVSLLLLLLISSCTLQEVDYQREDIATIKQKFEAVYDEDSNISLDVNWNDFREYQIGTEKVYEFSVSSNVTIESHTNARVQGEKETIMTLVAVDRVEQTLFALRHLSLYGEREYLDYNNLSEGFTGIETFYTLDLKFEQSRVVKNGLTVDWGKDSRKESSGATNKTQGCFTVTRDIYTTTCIDGTNDCWTTYSHTETITFCEEGFDRGDSGGGGGLGGGSGGGVGGGSSSAGWSSDIMLFQDISGKINDIDDYLDCFNLTAGGEFVLYVDQPNPGTRDTWVDKDPSYFNVEPDVGHTFVSITQGNMTRVLGFYPNGPVQPGVNPSSQSALINDSRHEYDVSIEVDLNSSQMKNLISFIKSFSNNYNLNTYNCTDFGLGAASECGLDLPDTYGTWPLGGGSNPGDLGEDLRSMSNGDINKDGGNAKLNKGNCD